MLSERRKEYLRNYYRERRQNDKEYRIKDREYRRIYYRERYKNDEEYRKKNLEYQKQYKLNKKKLIGVSNEIK